MKREGSGMTPGFRAWATGWMTVPFAEMGSQDEAQVWGEDTELGSWLVKVGVLRTV